MVAFARVGSAAAAVALLTAALAGCVPERGGDVADPAASAGASSPTANAPSAASTSPVAVSPRPEPTSASTPGAIPSSCDDVYSPTMRATLEQTVPSLNDPGVTLLSTDQATLLELLETVPTIRCTWGTPSERGMSTNVSVVSESQAETVRAALRAAGFGCEEDGAATVCRVEQRGVSLDDVPYERGETQAVSGSLWVTTSWINVDPPGYTQDILSTVAG